MLSLPGNVIGIITNGPNARKFGLMLNVSLRVRDSLR
jgi:hypothetical protein